jgi:hypothetical protein
MSPSTDHRLDDVISAGNTSSFSHVSGLSSNEEVSASGDQCEPLIHHAAYYLKDEHIKLQAENTIFRIHSYFFIRESDKARALVEQALTAEERLVKLYGVAVKDLESFCEVLYCSCSFSFL